jgi:hypothetical protein
MFCPKALTAKAARPAIHSSDFLTSDLLDSSLARNVRTTLLLKRTQELFCSLDSGFQLLWQLWGETISGAVHPDSIHVYYRPDREGQSGGHQ